MAAASAQRPRLVCPARLLQPKVRPSTPMQQSARACAANRGWRPSSQSLAAVQPPPARVRQKLSALERDRTEQHTRRGRDKVGVHGLGHERDGAARAEVALDDLQPACSGPRYPTEPLFVVRLRLRAGAATRRRRRLARLCGVCARVARVGGCHRLKGGPSRARNWMLNGPEICSASTIFAAAVLT
jgi:hypothetical protein